MKHEFRLVDIGEGLTEAEIVSWLVAVGDHVVEDQPVVEIETDKAVVEMPAPVTGTVVALGGDVGAVISVGEVLLVVDDGGDDGGDGRVDQPAADARDDRSSCASPAPAPVPAARTTVATGRSPRRRRGPSPASWASTCRRLPAADPAAGSSTPT